MKRVISTFAVVALFVFACGSIASARAAATVETFPVNFVLTSATCANLAPGTTLAGSGIEKSITTTRIDKSGNLIIENSTQAQGTALDQSGNVYVFNYSNDFRGILDDEGVLAGTMTDSFSLAGKGPARLNNGFHGQFVTDFATFFSVPVVASSHGDPLDFVTGATHCDPL